MLNDAGYVVQEPTSLEVPPYSQQVFRDALEQWREDWENTVAAVDDLVSLVEGFYVIDRDAGMLEDFSEKLG